MKMGYDLPKTIVKIQGSLSYIIIAFNRSFCHICMDREGIGRAGVTLQPLESLFPGRE